MPQSNRQQRPPEGRDNVGPLKGLRVVDLTNDHPGALATMFLADYGADVVKVVPSPGIGLETGPEYLVWNRNKRAMQAPVAELLAASQALIERADVVVESLAAAGKAAYLAASKRNPGLIWCSITPYGATGPLAGRVGYEALVAAVAGIHTEQRGPDNEPTFNPLPIAGIGTALLAIQSVLAAIYERRRSGSGQLVETSLYQGAIAARSPMLVRGEGVQTWDSAGNDPQGALPNYRLYECADGNWLHLGTLIPVFWNKLIIALDLFEFATDPRFESAPLYWPSEEVRAAAKRLLAEKFRTKDRAHWLQLLRDGDVPVSPATPTHELFSHPQVVANGLSTSIVDPRVGPLEQAMPPVALSATPGGVRRAAPEAPQDELDWESATRFFEAQRERAVVAGRGPLAGLRVLDLSSYLAGPIGPAYLADLGADVIKVEPPTGEGCRMIMMLYLGGNPSKRGLALDLKSPASREPLVRLIERSDVVVHNNRVGVAERLGLDYDSVRRIRPDVIYLQSTAYGSKGPDARQPGFDPLFQSLTGIGLAQAGPGRPPVFPKTPICDIATAMLGATAVLLAVAHRDRTGQGQLIETSLLATGLWLKSDAFVRYAGHEPRAVTNADNSGTNLAHRWYRCRDGFIFVACRLPGERSAFEGQTGVRAAGEALAEQAAERELAGLFATRTVGEWLERLDKAGVPAERVAMNNDEGVYQNPQAAHLQVLANDPYPGFTNLRQPGVLVRFSRTPARRRSGSPACGEHTVEVLREIGFADDAIRDLESKGVAGVYRPGG